MQGNVAVLVYFYHESSEYGYGVLRYDLDRQKIISDQRAGKNARMSYMYNMNQFINMGPEVASDGQNIFVAHTLDGILVFPNDGPPRLLNEANGLASQKIWNLVALDGKLYAIIGSPYTETGVMEVDWKSGTSRVLWSQRSQSANSQLDGLCTRGILADSNRHLLWLLVSEADRPGVGGKKVSLFTYSPRDTRFEEKQKKFTCGSRYSMRWTEGAILLWDVKYSLCLLYNPDTDKGEMIYAKFSDDASFSYRKQTQPKDIVWRMPQAHDYIRRLAFLGDELLALRDRELLWFHTGVADPVSMLARIFPKEIADQIYFFDVALTKQGMLMLSMDGLYLVPEIKAPTQPAATAASK